MFEAIYEQQPDRLKQLLANPAINLNAISPGMNHSPLQACAVSWTQREGMAMMLLEAKADVDLKTPNGFSFSDYMHSKVHLCLCSCVAAQAVL